jgi:hypothetical protein
MVYQFDTNTNKLTTPVIQGKIPPSRAFTKSVSYKGKIYIFSGLLRQIKIRIHFILVSTY